MLESWLSSDISSNELFPPNFNVFRKDRSRESTARTKGGGVLLAVKNNFSCTDLDLSSFSEVISLIDIIGIKITNQFLSEYAFYFITNSKVCLICLFQRSLHLSAPIVIIILHGSHPKLKTVSEAKYLLSNPMKSTIAPSIITHLRVIVPGQNI